MPRHAPGRARVSATGIVRVVGAPEVLCLLGAVPPSLGSLGSCHAERQICVSAYRLAGNHMERYVFVCD